jgi:hypothetical protein
MKKILAILVLLFICGSTKVMSEPITWTGSGTLADPYQITTAAELATLATNVNAGTNYVEIYFKLMNDISLSGYASWTPIGKVTSLPDGKGFPFSGNFNGNSKTISGLSIALPASYSVYGFGLFGWVSAKGTVSNLTVSEVNITASAYKITYVSGLVGANQGTVDGCSSSGNIANSSLGESTGGLVGENYGVASVVKNSQSSVNVTGGSYAGGLVGMNYGTVDNSHASGNINGVGRIGGLVGRNQSTLTRELGIVKNSYSEGNVTGSGQYIGGFIGYTRYIDGPTTVGYVENCYSTGTVSGSGSWVGGFIGYFQGANAGTTGGGYIKDCHHSIGSVTGFTHVGGFIGYYVNAFIGTVVGIENCYSSGSVSGTQNIGGFIGYTTNNSVTTYGGGYIKNCHSIGSVTASSAYSGGFIGYSTITYTGTEVSYIENCWASGAVNGAGYTGGFIGYNYAYYNSTVNPGEGVDIKGYIKNCYASGDIVSTGSKTGGFVGNNYFNYARSVEPLPSDLKLFGHLQQCYSTGAVTGTGVQVGGFVGYNQGAFSNATLPVNRAVGGSIHDCYSQGNVIMASGGTATSIGGFCGENNYIINRCYALGSVTYTGGTNPTDKGFLGLKASTLKVLNQMNGNFWNTTTSAQSTDAAAGATSKTTAEMKSAGTFLSGSWDFTLAGNLWATNGTDNSGYPYLRWQGYVPSHIWLGTSTTDWTTNGNWSENSLPAAKNVIVPDVTNNPVISEVPGSPATCNNLSVETGGVLTIAAGKALTIGGNLANSAGTTGLVINSDDTGTGSLKILGSVSGEAKVERYMAPDMWHLISSPTANQPIINFLNDNTDIATTGTTGAYTFAMKNYNDIGTGWIPDYYTSGKSTGDLFVTGKGYLLYTFGPTVTKIAFFEGALNTLPIGTNVSVISGWNLVGNPYTTAININDGTTGFVSVNSTLLPASYAAVYFWDGVAKEYVAVNDASPNTITPVGQGFFVRATSAGSISFNSDMQVHDGSSGFKAAALPRPTIKLIANNGTGNASTLVKFMDGAHEGLDVGYDAGIFKANPEFSVYTKLVEDNGIEFQLQFLPINQYNKLVIPVGIDSKAAGEIVFTVETVQLDPTCKVILEDKLTNTFTDLSKGDYKAAITADTKGAERFFLHTGDIISGMEDQLLADGKLTAYAKGNKEIRVLGEVGEGAVATLVNGLGQVVLMKKLDAGNLNIIGIPNLKSGFYMLNINGKVASQTIKVMVRN